MARRVLLLTIGAGQLPEVTPIIPVTTTPLVDGHAANALAPATAMTATPTVDGVDIAWTASIQDGCSYIIEAAVDTAGTAGPFAEVGRTTNTLFSYPLQAARWVRVRATLNGRVSDPTGAVLVAPIPSSQIAANAAATTALTTRMDSAEGAISAQASAISAVEASLAGKASASAVAALDARVTSTEAGVATYFASYTLTLDVNGKISGFKSVNDGSVSLFEVSADVFRVVKPSGGDALTWTDSVLSAVKGSNAVKIGAGFGSNDSGKRLIFRYGPEVANASASRETSPIFIAENGDHKFGGLSINLGGGWTSGAAITYTASAGTPATATISVSSGVLGISGRSYSYGASSVSVSGTGGTTVTYYLYYEDPGLLGGTRTLYASTDAQVTYNSDSKVLIGSCKVTFPSSGTGGGGGTGGGDCVDYDSVLPDGRRVCDLQPGDLVECVDVRTGARGLYPLLAIGFGWADCYRVVTAHGEVIQSDTTPMDMPDGSVVRTHALAGHPVLQRECGWEIAAIEYLGPRRVCKPDLGDRMFFAGTAPERCIATHNIRYKDPV